ncbi:septum site-determining protein MinC [Anoxybacter fermentans]|uniref:Probable septum site-determining protein MinC n=1 Tax=Anoxybacter fermentans TaxID=1323375 RepID=A0A3Q9HQU9_9FIRM|nr:septum site-determining protein MinC [Anoxybacter fermentans]AZR73284.1 septum site-determining protein MinC [Anoxybacter fermentans]
MTQQGVLIKGNNDGIIIYLNEQIEFAVILDELKEKFTNAYDFFKGASVTINPGKRIISPEEKMALINLCQEFELAGIKFETTPMVTPEKKKRDLSATEGNTLILKRTIRSGQRISYKGNVVIIGDVNPGAEVIAQGDVVVMGSLRGVVHAGAQGDTDAEVFALLLQPTQLRIAHCIARSPDGYLFKKKGKAEPEKARIRDGFIVIEGIED